MRRQVLHVVPGQYTDYQFIPCTEAIARGEHCVILSAKDIRSVGMHITHNMHVEVISQEEYNEGIDETEKRLNKVIDDNSPNPRPSNQQPNDPGEKGTTFMTAMLNMRDCDVLARRKSWPSGRKLYYVGANEYAVKTNAARSYFGDGAMVPYAPYIAEIDNDIVTMYIPKVEDIYAEDWETFLC